MFGIGLPELILIMALALIVVGPDKLPELAKSLAKGIMELKGAASSLSDSLKEEVGEKPWDDVPGTDSPPVDVIKNNIEDDREEEITEINPVNSKTDKTTDV
jgi:sec-independent protein translocase protein TatB